MPFRYMYLVTEGLWFYSGIGSTIMHEGALENFLYQLPYKHPKKKQKE
jgi:hypothetical protein